MRYRDVLFIIFSIALTAFLLVCAFRGGHMIFDNLEDDRKYNQRQQQAQEWVDHCRQIKDAEVFSACIKAYR